ncbi:MAG: bifunctional 5,10-methylenetetrahydrofolate dehydrogenase/5,10-methenyltetrahydrofolate cyclohydrolase, partial [Candidatus Omnitrophica bacterium]|nr:bifunctional 5,10-methylenetetrahydrofolate dehydrogenase/5,10-methenyltetrahydrofolate cyclohydrolase [Candidatus Omnitrophota bacterium]
MAIIFDAQKKYDSLLAEIKAKLDDMPKLCLASVAIGQDVSAKSYRWAQEKLAKELGIEYRPLDLGLNNSYQDFKTEIERLDRAKEVTGIILDKPFPSKWSDADVFSLLSESKDIEGMHPGNLGRFFLGQPKFISPTVLSILEVLDESKVELRGKRVTIIGFSPLIGRPLALWLGSKFATVSITHIATFQKGDLPFYIKSADIVISA